MEALSGDTQEDPFFMKNGKVCVTERIRDYARLLCSVGINGISINNVNVRNGAEWLISERHYKELEQISHIFAQYGISMYLCIDFAAPMTLGGLSCADPLKEEVKDWWEKKCGEIFGRLPNMGGFLVKADSEASRTLCLREEPCRRRQYAGPRG